MSAIFFDCRFRIECFHCLFVFGHPHPVCLLILDLFMAAWSSLPNPPVPRPPRPRPRPRPRLRIQSRPSLPSVVTAPTLSAAATLATRHPTPVRLAAVDIRPRTAGMVRRSRRRRSPPTATRRFDRHRPWRWAPRPPHRHRLPRLPRAPHRSTAPWHPRRHRRSTSSSSSNSFSCSSNSSRALFAVAAAADTAAVAITTAAHRPWVACRRPVDSSNRRRRTI